MLCVCVREREIWTECNNNSAKLKWIAGKFLKRGRDEEREEDVAGRGSVFLSFSGDMAYFSHGAVS